MTNNDILMIDDKPENLHVISEMLRYSGYTVRGVTNAQQALAVIAEELPELILMDIMIPGDMNGYALCRHLKADEMTRTIPVIFISALDDTLDKVRAFDVGAVDYITKPFQLEEVLARVETQLKLRYQQREITRLHEEEYRYYERLAEVQQDLLRSTTHDLKNPLSVIMSYAHLLDNAEQIRQDDQLREYVQIVLESSQQMQRLISELLEIARLETGIDLRLEPTDPILFFAEYVNPFYANADKKDILFKIDLPQDAPLIKIDRQKMGRAISNLIANAIKYTLTGGQVTVWLRADTPGKLRMGVTDNGIGIPEDVQDAIFEKFYRVQQSEHQQQVGTGLGLAITKTIINQHNGDLSVESKPGIGSTFTMLLPTMNVSSSTTLPD